MADWIDDLFTQIEEGGDDTTLSDNQREYLYSLLDTSSISEERRAFYDSEIEACTVKEYYGLLLILQNNQPDPIACGRNYSQTDIKQHLSKITGDD